MKILPLLAAAAALSIQASVANGASPSPAASTPSGFTQPAASSSQPETASPVAPGPMDSRIVAWVDPNQALSSYARSTILMQLGKDSEGNNIQRDITTFPEPGYLDPRTGQFTVMRITDPMNAARKAFRHKIIQGMSYRQDKGYQSARASILTQWGRTAPAVLHDGVPYWAAFAIYVDNDHPFDGTGDHISILSLGHAVSSSTTQSMNKIDLRKDGNLRLWVQSNPVLDGDNSTSQGSVFDIPVERGVWNYIVLQWKYEWDVAKVPYTRLWRAVGDGAPIQIVNTNIANAFRETAGYHPWKFGIYMWNVRNGWGSSSSRTIYTKGIQIFRDEPGTPTLDVRSMFALLRSQ